jgi:hypothetical protein
MVAFYRIRPGLGASPRARNEHCEICYTKVVLTAGITAAVAAILAIFGIKPGPYLVVVAAVVKGLIVVLALLLGRRVLRGRAAAGRPKPSEESPPPSPEPPSPSPGP